MDDDSHIKRIMLTIRIPIKDNGQEETERARKAGTLCLSVYGLRISNNNKKDHLKCPHKHNCQEVIVLNSITNPCHRRHHQFSSLPHQPHIVSTCPNSQLLVRIYLNSCVSLVVFFFLNIP